MSDEILRQQAAMLEMAKVSALTRFLYIETPQNEIDLSLLERAIEEDMDAGLIQEWPEHANTKQDAIRLLAVELVEAMEGQATILRDGKPIELH